MDSKVVGWTGVLLVVALIVLLGGTIRTVKSQRDDAVQVALALQEEVESLGAGIFFLSEELRKEHETFHLYVDSINAIEPVVNYEALEWGRVADSTHGSFAKGYRILEQMMVEAEGDPWCSYPGNIRRQLYRIIEVDAYTHMALAEQLTALQK